MKKQNEKSRRLSLSRETIRCLDEPKLVEAAGGAVICPTDSLTRPTTGAEGGGE